MKLIPNFLRRTKPKVFNPDAFRRSYAGASQGTRYSDFNPTALDPLTSAPQWTLTQLRSRARDLQRNSEFAATGIQILTSRLISKQGLAPRFMVDNGFTITESMIKIIRDTATLPDNIRLLLSERGRTSTERYESLINALWDDFASNADFTGGHSFSELVKISVIGMIVNGETLIKRHTVDSEELAVPLQLQMIEADLINDNEDNFTDRYQGVNVDPIINRPISIRLYTNNPGGINFNSKSYDVSMEDLVHLKEDFRPGQLRGVSWLATIILALRDMSKAQSSELSRQAVASLFVGVVSGGDKSLLPGATERTDGTKITDAKMSPATFYFASEGETVNFSTPAASTGFNDFVKINLQRIATGLRIPYYSLSQDYASVNYSTARMAEQKALELLSPIRQSILVENMMCKIAHWFTDAIALRGIPNFNLKHVVAPMAATVVDAQKEMDVVMDELNNGIISWSEAVRKAGREPDLVKQQILDDNEWFTENGISFSIYNQRQKLEEEALDNQEEKEDNTVDN